MKKILTIITTVLTILVLSGGGALAEGKVTSEFANSKQKIEGTVSFDGVVQNNGHELSATVEASDLFKGAYDKYVKDFKGQLYLGRPYDKLVMFSKDKQFPMMTYTVVFPKGVTVDVDKITMEENTATISKIEKTYDENSNSITFKFYLGNWNDYEGFFKLVESELNTTGHTITINIPYDKNNVQGTIKASGKCELYHYKWFIVNKIVDITSPQISLEV